jgi:DNA-directed RNA polymerase specialized sigma24 family protein
MRDEGDEKGIPDDGDRFTVTEMHDSIEGLSDADFARLESASRSFSRLCGIEAKDLLQEAYRRALDGSRTCGRDTEVVPFLCGVMRSLASQEVEARQDGHRPVAIMKNGEPVPPDVAADIVSPEQAAISAIDDRGALAKIEALVADDEQLQLLIEGIDDNMRGAELQELLGTDQKGLAALRRRFRRLLQGPFPDRIAS